MTPSFRRWFTLRDLRATRAELGDLHTDTWAAYGRACAVWTESNLHHDAPDMPELSVNFPSARHSALTEAKEAAEHQARLDNPSALPQENPTPDNAATTIPAGVAGWNPTGLEPPFVRTENVHGEVLTGSILDRLRAHPSKDPS